MPHTLTKPTAPQLALVGGKLVVDVPWHLAGALQYHLHKHGVGATLHLDPVLGEARLEVWDGVNEHYIRNLLAHWRA